MKKLFLMLVLVGMVAGQAFAGPVQNTADFNQFRMVGSGSSESFGGGNPNDLKTFGWGDYIFAFVKIQNSLPDTTDVTFRWIAPDTTSGVSSITATFPANKKAWSSFTDSGMAKQAGLWNVEASFTNQAGATVTETRQFIITPEPMAMLLYGLGGLPIAAHLLRRRKIAA